MQLPSIVVRLVVALALFAGSSSELRAQLVVPMTEEETMRLEQLASDLSACSNPDCAAMGNAMGSLQYTYYSDNWSCEWHPEGCIGENFGDGTAWISRQGGDGTGQNAIDSAVTAAHEAGHTSLGTSNDNLVDYYLYLCLSLVGW